MVVKVFDLLFFGRPMLLIPVWTVYFHFLAVTSQKRYFDISIDVITWVHIGILSLLFMAVYGLNQIFDIESDRANDKLYFLPKGIISVTGAWVYYTTLTAISLAISLSFGFGTGLTAICIAILGALYSLPKVRLKDRPVAGLLANAIAYGVLVPIMAFRRGSPPAFEVMTIPYFMAIATGYILTTIPDRTGDAASGKRTVSVILGRNGALLLALLTSLATVGFSLALDNPEVAAVAAGTGLLVLTSIFSASEPLLMFTCKFPILLLALLAGLHFPAYLALLLLTIILTRVYYKLRFTIDYPKLG